MTFRAYSNLVYIKAMFAIKKIMLSKNKNKIFPRIHNDRFPSFNLIQVYAYDQLKKMKSKLDTDHLLKSLLK